jgi:hypothetical protein
MCEHILASGRSAAFVVKAGRKQYRADQLSKQLVLALASLILTSCGAASDGGSAALSITSGGATAHAVRERLYVNNGFGEPNCGYPIWGFDISDSGDVPPRLKLCAGPSLHGLLQTNDGMLYVSFASQAPSNTRGIWVYAADVASGGAPIRVINCGGITDPGRMALDSSGNLYVTNGTVLTEQNVLVFPPGANGCITGNRIIAGPHTGLSGPRGVAIRGDILYVSTGRPGACGPPGVLEFRAAASGDAAPVAVINGPKTLIGMPGAIGFDRDGNLYVANSTLAGSSILVFAPGASGDVAPTRVIEGPDSGLSGASDLSVRSDGTLYVANYYADDVTVYAPGENGDVPPIRVLGGPETMIRFTHSVSVPPE